MTSPSFKIDHVLSRNAKISGYYSWTMPLRVMGNRDGLPEPVTTSTIGGNATHIARLNIDLTLSPTMMVTLGGGYMQFLWPQRVNEFDSETELGLKGTYSESFPSIWGLSTPQGGMGTQTWTVMGPNNIADVYQTKPTANASLTWVRKNHAYKIGTELRFEGNPTYLNWPANGSFNFSAIETGLPSTEGQNLKGGYVGFPYASFLMGRVNNGQIGPKSEPRVGKGAYALFVQDSWKATHKLTIDYGLRWDYQTYLKEQYGRVGSISADVPNPAVGNIPGGVVFEPTYGPFARNYKYAFQPRLGIAYRITEKTVLRAGGLSTGRQP
jgi:outer membrane receptor protein involved in Fe transport